MPIREKVKRDKQKSSGKWGLPIIYDETKMRSKMEAEVAYIFDVLEIEWEYEPIAFQLKNSDTYIPDFHLPSLDTWVEVKGDMTEEDKQKIRFFHDMGKEIVILQENKLTFLETDFQEGIRQKLYIGKCSNCGEYFFCGQTGMYNCRNCGHHNGDHDVTMLYNTDLDGLKDHAQNEEGEIA